MHPYVCVCVFLHDNSKRNRSRNMKFKYIAVNENNSDKFDIKGHPHLAILPAILLAIRSI